MPIKYSLLLMTLISHHLYADTLQESKYELLSHLSSTIGGLNDAALRHSNKSNLAKLRYSSKFTDDVPFNFVILLPPEERKLPTTSVTS